MTIFRAGICAALLLLALFGARSASAQSSFQVTLDLSALSGLGTYYLDFQLTDGSQTDNANSKVVIRDAQYGSGITFTGALAPLGDASGDFPGTLTLRDNGAGGITGLADYAAGFSVAPGNGILSFYVDFSASRLDTNPRPDGFSLALLDGNIATVPTNGPTGTELLSADFTNFSPVPTPYRTLAGALPNGGVVRPMVVSAAVTAPEPPALTYCGWSLGTLFLARRRRRFV